MNKKPFIKEERDDLFPFVLYIMCYTMKRTHAARVLTQVQFRVAPQVLVWILLLICCTTLSSIFFVLADPGPALTAVYMII